MTEVLTTPITIFIIEIVSKIYSRESGAESNSGIRYNANNKEQFRFDYDYPRRPISGTGTETRRGQGLNRPETTNCALDLDPVIREISIRISQLFVA